MTVLLKDIAARLQLSPTTVSWVLTGKGDERGISKKTQELVKAAAREMNYQPNLLARNLKLGNTMTLGLVLPSIADQFYASVAHDIEEYASSRGYSLMIASSESDKDKENKVLQLFHSKGVDGILLAPTRKSTHYIQQLITEGYPLVTFDRFFPELNLSSVLIDNQEASRRLVAHMVEQGCRRIAVLTTNPNLITMNRRVDGYRQALRDAGIEVDERLVGTVEYAGYERNIVSSLDSIFEAAPDIDGFFFTTHILALEAFLYFGRHGIDYNSRFQMATIHSIPFFEVLCPRLHYADMPVGNMAREMVDILLSDIEARRKKAPDRTVKNVVLPCTLHFNDSPSANTPPPAP